MLAHHRSFVAIVVMLSLLSIVGTAGASVASVTPQFTKTVISVEESSLLGRLWDVFKKIVVGGLALGVVALAIWFLISGLWLPLIIIGAVLAGIWKLIVYVVTGEEP